jgi:hypothetical protein
MSCIVSLELFVSCTPPVTIYQRFKGTDRCFFSIGFGPLHFNLGAGQGSGFNHDHDLTSRYILLNNYLIMGVDGLWKVG